MTSSWAPPPTRAEADDRAGVTTGTASVAELSGAAATAALLLTAPIPTGWVEVVASALTRLLKVSPAPDGRTAVPEEDDGVTPPTVAASVAAVIAAVVSAGDPEAVTTVTVPPD